MPFHSDGMATRQGNRGTLMGRISVVDSAWTRRRAFLMGGLVAAVSIVLLRGLDKWNEAWNSYEMPDALFAPLFLGIVLIYPLLALVIFYRRLPRALLGLTCVLGFGVGWYVTMEALQVVEYGPWKGFRADEKTLFDLLWRHATRVVLIVAVCAALGMSAWGLCRLFRGRVIVQDGTLCSKCAYSLIGNVSGRCPECGERCEAG